jgi:hypothetical protein
LHTVNEGKRPLGRPRRRWEDNIKIDLQEVGIGGRYWLSELESRYLHTVNEGKSPLGRPRRRWEDNIKIDLEEVGIGVGTGLIWLRIGRVGGHL